MGSEFVDDAAEVNDDEISEDGDDEQFEGEIAPRKRRMEDDNSDNEIDPNATDSSEEDDEEVNEYDLDDKFIAQEGEEEEEDEGTVEGKDRKRKHKRRRDKSPELDEEDYQLLEENQVTGIRRKPKSLRKRIRKQSDAHGKTDAQRLQEELFGGDDDGAPDDDDDVGITRHVNNLDEDLRLDEDEMAGFIDDDEDDEGVDVEERRERRRINRSTTHGIASQGVQEMLDIFGDVDELLDTYMGKRAQMTEGSDAMPLPPDDEDDDVAMQRYQLDLERYKSQKKYTKVLTSVDPVVSERLMLLPEDDRIRSIDAPERMILAGMADLKALYTDDEIHQCAEFILHHLLGPSDVTELRLPHSSITTCHYKRRVCEILEEGVMEVDGKPRDITYRPREETLKYDPGELEGGIRDLSMGRRGVRRERRSRHVSKWRQSLDMQIQLLDCIKKVLEEMWNMRHEIPLIAMFRKEICGELLSMRHEDMPGTTSREELSRSRKKSPFEVGMVQAHHRRIRRWDVLWAILEYSQKWRTLHKRKGKRLEIFNDIIVRCDALLEGMPEGSKDVSIEQVKSSLQRCIGLVNEARFAEDLNDVDFMYKTVTNIRAFDLIESVGAGKRRPTNLSAYSALKSLNLSEVSAAICISPSQFGDNLSKKFVLHSKQDLELSPLEFALSYVQEKNPLVSTADLVLARARQLLVIEIMAEPRVRAFVRLLTEKHMQISTDPTTSGDLQLDAFHPLGAAKRLREMPISALYGTDIFLQVYLAQKEGLVTITSEVVNLEEIFVRPMLELIQSTHTLGAGEVGQEWSTMRSIVVRSVVQKLVPQLQFEISQKLLMDAKAAVTERIADEFWHYASTPPLHPIMEDGDEIDGRRFAACCWGEGHVATCLVMLDEQGALLDIVHLPSMSGSLKSSRGNSSVEIAEDPKKKNDVSKVVEFCRRHKPHVILVGASNIHCKVLKEDLSRINDYILDAHAQIFTSDHDTGSMEVCCVDEQLADLWAKSYKAKNELPEHSEVIRRAVAIGRFALEPLGLLTSLATGDKGILSLDLHPLQRHISEEEIYNVIEKHLITAVSQIGINVNSLISSPWLGSMLNFIPGMGPRKAAALLQAVAASNFVSNRMSIWKEIGKPGNVVFRNCGVYLKVSNKGRRHTDSEVDIIDTARIEPLNYQLAVKMASAMLRDRRQDTAADGGGGDGSEDEVDSDFDDEDQSNVARVIENRQLIEKFNIEKFHAKLYGDVDVVENPTVVENTNSSSNVNDTLAEEGHVGGAEEQAETGDKRDVEGDVGEKLEGTGVDDENISGITEEKNEGNGTVVTPSPKKSLIKKNMISTMIDIAMEFIAPDADLRPGNYLDIAQSKERQFWWLVGQRPYVLRVGRKVEAIVRYVGRREASCIIPEFGGLSATLSEMDISSSGVVEPESHLKVGQSITARIKAIRPDDFVAELVTHAMALNDDASWERQYLQKNNRYYHIPSPEEVRAAEAESRRQSRTKEIARRTVNHPHFKNATLTEAMVMLSDMPAGEAIFRPSTHGTRMLVLSIKLHSGVDGDLVVNRDIREGKKHGGELGLGTPLRLSVGPNKEQIFEDLDEILARYVEPYVAMFRNVSTHRKFKEGSWEDIKSDLRRGDLPHLRGTAIYCLAADDLHPGMCVTYKDLERLLMTFKKNPVGPGRMMVPPPAPPLSMHSHPHHQHHQHHHQHYQQQQRTPVHAPYHMSQQQPMTPSYMQHHKR